MKRRASEEIPQERDRHLDIPSEANRDKHINFLKEEQSSDFNEVPDRDSPFYIPGITPHDSGPQEDHRA